MRIYLAGEAADASLSARHPYRLLSYFYLNDQTAGELQRYENVIMDSGLFSFLFGASQDEMPPTFEAYRDYTLRYLDAIDRWDYKGVVVEIDAHKILGMDAVFRLREEFKHLGDRVIYVWHHPEGLDGLETLAKKYSYIAISVPEMRLLSSGRVRGESKRSKVMVNNLLRRVHKVCGDSPPRIHLLGCTVQSLMQTRLAWSCDSSSWTYGIRYGSAMIFENGRIRSCRINSELFAARRKKIIEMFPESVDFASTKKNPEYYKNCVCLAHAYAEYQKWLDKHITNVPMRGAELPGGPYVDQGKA